MFKLLVSSILWLCDRGLVRLNRWAGRQPPATCTVLYYHSVPQDARAMFGRQMDLLVKLARPLAITCNPKLDPGVHYVTVTFDDAFSSFAHSAMPELLARRIPCTVFVPAGCLGEEPNWDNPGNVSWNGEKIMNGQDLSRVTASGLVTLGAHGWRHRNLPRLSEIDLLAELQKPKALLERLMGATIHSMSFPFGAFGVREIRLAKETGYHFLFCSQPIPVRSELRPGLIGRVGAEPTDWLPEFHLKLSGAYRWLAWVSPFTRHLRRLGRLLRVSDF